MSNEEKANEIAQQAEYTKCSHDVDIAFKAAMQMSEWKDSQYKFLENDRRKLVRRLARTSEQISKMKNCANCKYFRTLPNTCTKSGEILKVFEPCKNWELKGE